MKKKIKLAIVEDLHLFRQGLIALLKDYPEIEIVIEAENGKQFVDKVKKIQPQVVLLDLEMPFMDGFEVTLLLHQKYPEIKIIILTLHNSEDYIYNLIERGAHGFLLKNDHIETIIDAIHAVLENGFYFNDNVSKAMVKGLLFHHKIKPSFNNVKLTEKEKEVLVLVCKEYTNLQIAEKLFIDIKTVETHKRNIIQKTNSKNIIGAVMYAIKNNLLDSSERGHVNGEPIIK